MKTSEILENCKQYLFSENNLKGKRYICHAIEESTKEYSLETRGKNAIMNAISPESCLINKMRSDSDFEGFEDDFHYVELRNKWLDNLITKLRMQGD